MNIVKRFFRIPFRIGKYLFNKSRFGAFGWHTHVIKPLRIEGASRIFLENRVYIHNGTWLAAMPCTGEKDCKLIIKKGSTIGDFCHIYSTKSIVIEENVLLANFVYISDNQHGYENVNQPIIKQSITQRQVVCIGEGSWLGEHVCIIGANVGKHCVIGANSVVTHDISDYCIAVGIPARVIKKYNFESHKWEKVKEIK